VGELARLHVCWHQPCRPVNLVTADPAQVTCPHCLTARLWDDMALIIERLRLLAAS